MKKTIMQKLKGIGKKGIDNDMLNYLKKIILALLVLLFIYAVFKFFTSESCGLIASIFGSGNC